MKVTEDDKKNFIQRYKDAGNTSLDEVEKFALEYYRIAPKIDLRDSTSCVHYAGAFHAFGQYSGENQYRAFLAAFTKSNIGEKLDFIEKSLHFNINPRENRYGLEIVDTFASRKYWQSDIEKELSKETLNRISTIMFDLKNMRAYNFDRYKDYQKIFYPHIKNNKDMPASLRQDIREYLIDYAKAELIDLKPEFHTIETIREAYWNSDNVMKLTNVLKYQAENKSFYYNTVGENSGKMPETLTQRFDKMATKLFRSDQLELKTKVRKQFILEDFKCFCDAIGTKQISEMNPNTDTNIDQSQATKRISNLEPHDTLNGLLEIDTHKRKWMLEKIDDDTLSNLKTIYKKDVRQFIGHKNFSELRCDLDATWIFSDKRTGEELQKNIVLLDSLTCDPSKSIREKALALKKCALASQNKFLEQSNDPGYLEAKAFTEDYQKKQSNLKARETAITSINSLRKAAAYLKSVCSKYPDICPQYNEENFNAYFAKAITGASIQLEPPLAEKKWWKFGTDKNKVNDENFATNKAFNEFNNAIQKLRRAATDNSSTQEILQKFEGNLYNEEIYNQTQNECNELKNSLDKEKGLYDWKQTIKSAKNENLNDLKRTYDRNRGDFETGKSNVEKQENKLKEMHKRLKDHKKKTQLKFIGKVRFGTFGTIDRDMALELLEEKKENSSTKEVFRDVDVPKTDYEKEAVSKKRYQARRKAIGKDR
jgi:hypothetical protein